MRLRIPHDGALSRLVAKGLDWLERMEEARNSSARAQQHENFVQRLLSYRRKAATLALVALAVVLFFRVIFGTNCAAAYSRKRAEYRSLQIEVDRLEKENRAIAEQNKLLKSDPNAIEREAREQLRYAKPGEVILVMPGGDPNRPPANADAEKR
jgi:cell division protein FtsB